MKLNTLIGAFLIIAIGAAFISYVSQQTTEPPADIATLPEEEGVMCTMDAMQCPDGSYVGRTGPNCEFVCPPAAELSAELEAHLDEKADLITLLTPVPQGVVSSPLTIAGQARGQWFFEASFPIVLTNWDGLIIAEGYATAEGDWMTTEFVPFTAELTFTSPFTTTSPEFMQRGSLILHKSNASGLPEHDDALEITVRFAATE